MSNPERVNTVDLAQEQPEIVRQELPQRESAPLPLFVAVNKGCDMGCWYCTENGENRSNERGRVGSPELLEVLGAAYESGVRTFRFTGGEPTLRRSLGDIMISTEKLGDDVRIALTTNGSELPALMPVLAELKQPSVFLSVDSYDDITSETEEQGIKLEKWLSPDLRQVIKERPSNVQMRMNFVLTAANKDQLPKLIDFAIEQEIDVKIFELLLRDYHYVKGKTSQEAFASQYASVRDLLPALREKYGETEGFAGTGGRGMPMFAFKSGKSRIICFDSNAGSHYGEACNDCNFFPCQEGLYALTLDTNGALHPSGCVNINTYANVSKADQAEKIEIFSRMASMIGQATLRSDIPAILETISKKG